MRRALLLLWLLAVPVLADVRHDVDAYYQDHKKVPPYAAAVQRGDVAYVAALLRQLYDDETTGRTALTATPFWGVGATVDARELRSRVVDEMYRNAHGEAWLDAVAFLLDTERLADNQVCAMTLLSKTRGPRADEMIEHLLAPPHPNQAVLLAALHEVRARHLKLDAVRPLCNHWRSAVRKAARALIADAPDYKPEMPAVLVADLQALEKMLPTPVPAEARLVRLSYRTGVFIDSKPERREETVWILDQTPKRIHLVDRFGMERQVDATEARTRPWTLAAEADFLLQVRQRVDAARNGFPRDADAAYLSRMGIGSAQFEPGWISLPEAVTALWLWQRHDEARAIALLLPRLEAAADDRWMGWVLRDLSGTLIHLQMLDAFAQDADYATASRLAHHLAGPVFDGYAYQARARELEQQLAARADVDFKTLKLPTWTEWETLKKTLSREQRVDYLVKRIRIMHARQWGQPGGISFSDEQPDRRINPFTELMAMKLTRKELEWLKPHVKDADFILGYSYFRDFHPARTLHRVGDVVQDVIEFTLKPDGP